MGEDVTHPLYDLTDILGVLIETYEADHHPIPDAPSQEVLRLLMEQHDLHQSDLPEIGSQGVVSEILAGKGEMNVHQMRSLAKRLSVSAAVFL
ncbi:MAG: hypothetical protein HQL52_16815 [Magnetococcales bacterium]|nr:hypothetical protein [Magnetococcales bacterium]